MAKIFDGRWTARMDPEDADGVVLFLIGMRINAWWRIDQWFWVIGAMTRMVRYLAGHPEAGAIRVRNWFGRTTMQVGYWRSLDHLVAFAEDHGGPHRPAWQRFYRQASRSTAVGIWHETYLVRPGGFETLYVNMPSFGLAEAVRRVPVDRSTSRARQRVRRPAHQPA